MVTNFADVPPSLMYDVLHDADYRKWWDDNMLECFEICQLDRYNDIGYYSSKWVHLCPDVLCSLVFTDQGDQRLNFCRTLASGLLHEKKSWEAAQAHFPKSNWKSSVGDQIKALAVSLCCIPEQNTLFLQYKSTPSCIQTLSSLFGLPEWQKYFQEHYVQLAGILSRNGERGILNDVDTMVSWCFFVCNEQVQVPCSPRVSHSSVVRASNRYLEGHGFDSHWGLRKFFFWVFQLENASSLFTLYPRHQSIYQFNFIVVFSFS